MRWRKESTIHVNSATATTTMMVLSFAVPGVRNPWQLRSAACAGNRTSPFISFWYIDLSPLLSAKALLRWWQDCPKLPIPAHCRKCLGCNYCQLASRVALHPQRNTRDTGHAGVITRVGHQTFSTLDGLRFDMIVQEGAAGEGSKLCALGV